MGERHQATVKHDEEQRDLNVPVQRQHKLRGPSPNPIHPRGTHYHASRPAYHRASTHPQLTTPHRDASSKSVPAGMHTESAPNGHRKPGSSTLDTLLVPSTLYRAARTMSVQNPRQIEHKLFPTSSDGTTKTRGGNATDPWGTLQSWPGGHSCVRGRVRPQGALDLHIYPQ